MKQLFVFLCAILLIFSVKSASATSVSILNPSFEYPTLTDGNTDGDIDNWDESNDIEDITWTSTWNPTGSNFDESVPDGNNVGNIYKVGWIAQRLSEHLSPNILYTLQVSVGKVNGSLNPVGFVGLGIIDPPFGNYPWTGSVLASKSLSELSWSYNGGEFNVATVTYETPAGSSDIGEDLWIYFVSTSNDSRVVFDNVTLDATLVPIPGAVWLFGSGIIGIAGIRRRFS